MPDEHPLPRHETASQLEASGASHASSDEPFDSLRRRVSHAMVGMKKDFYGKGPSKAKTYLNDEYVFVVMEGGLTRNEETLLAAGEYDLVRSYRLRFQNAMANTTIKAVEEILERKVLSYHSQILFEPTRAIEIFVLEPEAG